MRMGKMHLMTGLIEPQGQSSSKRLTVLFDKSRDRQHRRSSDLFRGIVRAREDACPVILSDFDEVLHQEGWEFVQVLHLLTEFLDRDRAVLDLRTEHFAHGGGDLGMVHLDRTMEGVDLALMAFRIGQKVGDDPSLVGVRTDWGVAPVREGKFDLLLGPDLLREMRIDSQSAKKVGRECVVATSDQSKTRSETQWSWAAWLVDSRRAEICDMLTIAVTLASFAAWAK